MPIKRFQTGEPIMGWPVRSWDTVADAVERLNSDPNMVPPPLAGAASKYDQVVNLTGSAIDIPFAILRLDQPINRPADNADAPLQPLVWEGKDPDTDTVDGKKGWAILQAPAPTNAVVNAVASGLSWVKIDIQSADDTTCGVIDGDNEKLESGTGQTPIVWKEDGTGEKWAIVLLGGGGGEPNIIYGLTTAATTGSVPFAIDNITVHSGHDPRSAPVSAGQTVTVKNTFAVDMEASTMVRAEQGEDGSWETIRPGAGGSSGSGQATSVFSFRLTGDKAATDAGVTARLVDENGNDLQPLTPDESVQDEAARLAMVVGAGAGEVEVDDLVEQVDSDTIWRYDGTDPSVVGNWTNMGPASLDIIAIDKRVNSNPGGFGLSGLADYTDCFGDSQKAFLGECRSVGVPNYGMTGKPGYEIISMEGLAESLLVKFKEKPTGSLNPISVEVLEVFGSNYCHRTPKSLGGTPPDVLFDVYDGNNLADNGEIDDVWQVERVQELDVYKLTSSGAQDEFLLMRGETTAAVNEATISFTLANILPVNGKTAPGLELTVFNDPICIFESGETAYARYDQTSQTWDTGDAHNMRALMKGLGTWNGTTDQSLGHNADEPMTWQDDSACDAGGA